MAKKKKATRMLFLGIVLALLGIPPIYKIAQVLCMNLFCSGSVLGEICWYCYLMPFIAAFSLVVLIIAALREWGIL